MSDDIAAVFIDLQAYADNVEDSESAPTIERYVERIKRDEDWIAFYGDKLATATRESERETCRTSIASLQRITATHQAKLEALRDEVAA